MNRVPDSCGECPRKYAAICGDIVPRGSRNCKAVLGLEKASVSLPASCATCYTQSRCNPTVIYKGLECKATLFDYFSKEGNVNDRHKKNP